MVPGLTSSFSKMMSPIKSPETFLNLILTGLLMQFLLFCIKYRMFLEGVRFADTYLYLLKLSILKLNRILTNISVCLLTDVNNSFITS